MARLDDLCDAVVTAAAEPESTTIETAVATLCDWVRSSPECVADIDIGVVRAVRSGRHFAALSQLTDTLNGLGHPDPRVRLFLAQGLIDTGSPSTAIDVLSRIRPDPSTPEVDIEVSGLIGRAFKDLFLRVNKKQADRRSKLMTLAVQHYNDAFTKSGQKDFWAGENLLALLRCAEKDGIDVGRSPQIEAIAARIKQVIKETPDTQRTYWQWATLVIVAINDNCLEDARSALGAALESDGADAFALGGTIRQLEEWWDIKGNGPDGLGLLAALKTRLLQLSGGSVRLSGPQMQAVREVPVESFEKIFGANGPVTHKWMLQFLDTGASVGQITTKLGDGTGTCFIIDGGEFHPSLAGERLILTNDHVVSPHPERYTSNPPLRVEKAYAKFEVFSQSSGLCEIAAKEVVWSSGAQDHDACLIRLKSDLPAELKALPIVRYLPVVDPSQQELVYIVGHPGGRSLSYSMQNNELLDHDCKPEAGEVIPRYIHYITPTEPGSSGSPALNAELDVIGLHHAGGSQMRKLNGSEDTYPANEAIWIDSICRAAGADLEAGRNLYSRP